MFSLLKEGVKQKNNAVKNGNSPYSGVPVACHMLKTVIPLYILVCILNPVSSYADIYKYVDENGITHFTNIRSDIRYTLYMKEARENPDAFINKYEEIIRQASEKFRIEPSLVKAVIKAESGFDHKAVSSKGAQGLMQLMPGTASDMEVDDPFNPENNIFGGTRYLSKMMERFNNNVRFALAAYNAGPDKVEEYSGVPPFKETETFIKRVMKYFDQYKSGK